MELATIKSMVIQDNKLDGVTRSDDFKSYATLAKHGYKPARKLAPLAKGYPLIDHVEVNKRLRGLGAEIPEETINNINHYDQSRDPKTGNPRNSRQIIYYNNSNLRCVSNALVANPHDGWPTLIYILAEPLKHYKGIIPPENSSNIAKALDAEVFDEIEIWYPGERAIIEAAVNYTPEVAAREQAEMEAIESKKRAELAERLLKDPIAVGIVTNEYKAEQQTYGTINRTCYYIDFWPEDIKLEDSIAYLLQ